MLVLKTIFFFLIQCMFVELQAVRDIALRYVTMIAIMRFRNVLWKLSHNDIIFIVIVNDV